MNFLDYFILKRDEETVRFLLGNKKGLINGWKGKENQKNKKANKKGAFNQGAQGK